MLGWREYAVVPATECHPVGDALPDPVAHLAQGMTAYGALTTAVPIGPGETVFVSGGAGSVGSMAGQIARLLGARRVVGSTGSSWKADQMVTRLGYDAVVVRDGTPLAEQLAKAAPDGIDVCFDNVGWTERFAGWLRAGTIAFPHVRVEGIEQAPRALHDALTGRYVGTVVVSV